MVYFTIYGTIYCEITHCSILYANIKLDRFFSEKQNSAYDPCFKKLLYILLNLIMGNSRLTRESIKTYFASGERPKVEKIGMEIEKIGVRFPEGDPVSYKGKNGFLAILGKMYEELGWKITKKHGSYIYQMKRGNAILDLESDGRIELAGSPHSSLHDVVREFRIHQHEMSEMSDMFGVSWLGIGYNPLASNDSIERLTDDGGRRDQIAAYDKEKEETEKNKYASEWTKGTAGIHVTLDYSSEEDFGKKSKVLFLLAPIMQAIFANSPFKNGDFSGEMNYRMLVTQKGVDKYALSKELFYSNFTYDNWIDFVCEKPALFFEREDKWIYPQKTFGEYLENGCDGELPVQDDFHMHMKSIWADIRMRNTIEIRVFDSLPPSIVPSVPAFVKGIIYDEENLEKLYEIVNNWSFEEFEEMKNQIPRNGLNTIFRGEKVLDFAKTLLDMAEDGLKRNRTVDAHGNDESVYLKPIKKFIFIEGCSPSHWLVKNWKGDWGQNFFPVFEWCKY